MAAVTSAIYDVIDALVDLAETSLPTVNIYDGLGISDDPGDFLMIGVEDADVESASSSASARQDWAHANFTARDEEGEVTCLALSWNGDGDQRAARSGVRAITNQLEQALRDNPSLGLPSVLWTSFGTDLELSQAQGEGGASAIVIFKVLYRARLNPS